MKTITFTEDELTSVLAALETAQRGLLEAVEEMENKGAEELIKFAMENKGQIDSAIAKIAG